MRTYRYLFPRPLRGRPRSPNGVFWERWTKWTEWTALDRESSTSIGSISTIGFVAPARLFVSSFCGAGVGRPTDARHAEARFSFLRLREPIRDILKFDASWDQIGPTAMLGLRARPVSDQIGPLANGVRCTDRNPQPSETGCRRLPAEFERLRESFRCSRYCRCRVVAPRARTDIRPDPTRIEMTRVAENQLESDGPTPPAANAQRPATADEATK